MTRVLTVVISGLIGAGLGALSGRILFGGTAWNLVPWAIGAVTIGLIADERRTALLASGIYGYALSVMFLYVANTSGSSLAQRFLFAIALGLIGPFCSVAVTVISRVARAVLSRQRSMGRERR